MDENILRRFIENPAQAVKLSQVGVITPVYSEGRVYAVNMGLPFCVFELPENELSSEDAKEYLDLAVEDIISSAAKAKEENKYFWYGKEFDYKKRLKSKRAKIAKEREAEEIARRKKDEAVALVAQKRAELAELRATGENAFKEFAQVRLDRMDKYRAIAQGLSHDEFVKEIFWAWLIDEFPAAYCWPGEGQSQITKRFTAFVSGQNVNVGSDGSVEYGSPQYSELAIDHYEDAEVKENKRTSWWRGISGPVYVGFQEAPFTDEIGEVKAVGNPNNPVKILINDGVLYKQGTKDNLNALGLSRAALLSLREAEKKGEQMSYKELAIRTRLFVEYPKLNPDDIV